MTDQSMAPTTKVLSGVPETLLITLAACMVAARENPDLRFDDPAAEAVGLAIGLDPDRFAGDKASMRGCIVRGKWLDRIVRRFLDDHPDGLVLSV